MYRRGASGAAASASFNNASASGFTVPVSSKDAADFAALVLCNANDPFGHPRWRYLADSI